MEEKRYAVMFSVDYGDNWYTYGVYDDRNKANEVAMFVRDERNAWVSVEER